VFRTLSLVRKATECRFAHLHFHLLIDTKVGCCLRRQISGRRDLHHHHLPAHHGSCPKANFRLAGVCAASPFNGYSSLGFGKSPLFFAQNPCHIWFYAFEFSISSSLKQAPVLGSGKPTVPNATTRNTRFVQLHHTAVGHPKPLLGQAIPLLPERLIHNFDHFTQFDQFATSKRVVRSCCLTSWALRSG
jgi:hypothetical protein